MTKATTFWLAAGGRALRSAALSGQRGAPCLLLVLLFMMPGVGTSHAQDAAAPSGEGDLGELGRKLTNPVADVWRPRPSSSARTASAIAGTSASRSRR